MKTKNFWQIDWRQLRRTPAPAPSLRVPVNTRNRALLRWMRSAELSAWQDVDERHEIHSNAQEMARPA